MCNLWNWKMTCSRKCCPVPCTDMASETLRYVDSACVRCGACEKACSYEVHHLAVECHRVDRVTMHHLLSSVKDCTYDALALSGRSLSVEDVIPEVMR